MCAGKIVWLYRATLEKPKFHGPFDSDERRFDDECVVSDISRYLGAGEQATGLLQLEEGGTLDLKPGFDICWGVIERGLCVFDEVLDSRTTHRR